MLENLIWEELYQQIPKQLDYNGTLVDMQVLRANQVVDSISYPALFVNFLDPVIDKSNTPLNEILAISLVDNPDGYKDVEYTKGVVLRQNIDLSLYDNNIQRIAKFQNDLFLWAKKDLSLTNVTVFDVLPPRNLDFVEEEYIYRRNIEIVCKFTASWEEIVTTIEKVETSVRVEE